MKQGQVNYDQPVECQWQDNWDCELRRSPWAKTRGICETNLVVMVILKGTGWDYRRGLKIECHEKWDALNIAF
eukprot:scaffold39051_cov15-Tisochrysis_lutea.AAC.3